MPTVIDSLVVLLWLDDSNYKKGRQTAEKETAETARKSKIAADEITKSLTEVGRTIAGLFLGFESATGFAKWLGSLNSGEAALGRTAANIGMSAHELNKWGNAVELAGGSAQDAQSAFSQLTQDFQKMNATGEQSALLQFFRARGVNIRDENGALRDQGQLFEELADKTARYGRAYQSTMLAQVGLSQGYLNYLVQAKDLREQQLAISERDNAVNDESVRKAAELQMYWRNIGLQIQAAGQMILTAVTPMMMQLLRVFGDINAQSQEFTTGLKLIGSAAIIIKNIFAGFGDALGGAVASLAAKTRGIGEAVAAAATGDWKTAARALAAGFREGHDILADQGAQSAARNAKEAADLNDLWSGQTAAQSAATVTGAATGPGTGGYIPPAGSKAARFNNPGNIQDAYGNERYYASPAEGEAALEKDLAAKMRRGLRTVDAIIEAYEGGDNVRNDIPTYIADVRKRLGKNELTTDDIKNLAQAIAMHESGPTPGLAATLAGGSGPRDNSVTVTTGDIVINTPSADPRAVAAEVPAAIQRKYAVTQADTGMQ